MKINEVEAAVGVTKKNIRFYEEEGLITPGREPGNGYRSYSQADVERERADALLLTGVNPANELIKLIKERDYDLVIIGNRGLSGVQEYLGSVSHKVLHGSPVSVLIAK